MSLNKYGATGLSVSILTTLFPVDVPRARGDKVGTIFRSPAGLSPLKVRSAKIRLKFGAISDNCRLSSRIYSVEMEMAKNEKQLDQTQPLPRWAKIFW